MWDIRESTAARTALTQLPQEQHLYVTERWWFNQTGMEYLGMLHSISHFLLKAECKVESWRNYLGQCIRNKWKGKNSSCRTLRMAPLQPETKQQGNWGWHHSSQEQNNNWCKGYIASKVQRGGWITNRLRDKINVWWSIKDGGLDRRRFQRWLLNVLLTQSLCMLFLGASNGDTQSRKPYSKLVGNSILLLLTLCKHSCLHSCYKGKWKCVVQISPEVLLVSGYR